MRFTCWSWVPQTWSTIWEEPLPPLIPTSWYGSWTRHHRPLFLYPAASTSSGLGSSLMWIWPTIRRQHPSPAEVRNLCANAFKMSLLTFPVFPTSAMWPHRCVLWSTGTRQQKISSFYCISQAPRFKGLTSSLTGGAPQFLSRGAENMGV